jgi:hypothetical protein
MADKADTEHAEHAENPEHEALLTGAIALASLFSNCVEAFGLIHPGAKWEREEQLLLTRLGLQQARLLIWGSVVGIASPPASVTDRAVPKNPSSAYPDLSEPTFFDARDPRLDESDFRTTIEETLSAIVDRSSGLTREEMMAKFGLRPPKRYGPVLEPAMDASRLESFREKYELLREVAESYAQLNTRRTNSITYQSWTIADLNKFRSFINLTQEKVDFLINLLDVKERVDRGMRMDIRVFGWHIMPDRSKTAQDISKLRLLQEICKQDYPEYVVATQQALDNINREAREYTTISPNLSKEQVKYISPEGATTNKKSNRQAKKRPGLLKLFKSFGKHHSVNVKDNDNDNDLQPSHSHSFSGPSGHPTTEHTEMDPPRSQSDAGAGLSRARSKSIGAGQHSAPPHPVIFDEDDKNHLSRMRTQSSGGSTVETCGKAIDSPLEAQHPVYQPVLPLGAIGRHDMYKGIARTETKDLHQADY